MEDYNILLTCEHGGNDVPDEYRHLFEDAHHVLETHRGWDIGILPFAEVMAKILRAPLLSSTVSRLLVELNRSLGHRQLFSEFSTRLPHDARRELLQKYYFPHREMVSQAVQNARAYGRVYHITVHSFTPELNGHVRNADITFLYDYRRKSEATLAKYWQALLQQKLPVRVRRNYPYRGHTDGLESALRKHWQEKDYVGLCVEVNQKHLVDGFPEEWPVIVSQTLRESLALLNQIVTSQSGGSTGCESSVEAGTGPPAYQTEAGGVEAGRDERFTEAGLLAEDGVGYGGAHTL